MKATTFIVTVLIIIVTAYLNGCKKEKSTSTTTPSCTDGIQNQGEAGIDCGGPCSSCPGILCFGDGSNKYFPLTKNNNWHYNVGTTTDSLSITVEDTIHIGNLVYTKVKYYEIPTGATYRYFRIDVYGNVMEYFYNYSQEYMAISIDPIVGQIFATYLSSSYVWKLKVISINATVTTAACTYTNCLQLGDYTQNDLLIKSYYYVKGIGMVKEDDGTLSKILSDVTLN